MNHIRLNDKVSLVSVFEYCPQNQSFLSNLELQYLIHIIANSESDLPIFDSHFVRQYKKHKKVLELFIKLRTKIISSLDILSSDSDGLCYINDEVRRFIFVMNERKVWNDFVIDLWDFWGGCVEILFTGNYYCVIEKDVFNRPQQVIKRKGEDFVFQSKKSGKFWNNPLVFDNFFYEGIQIKDYFQNNDILKAEAKMLSRMKKVV